MGYEDEVLPLDLGQEVLCWARRHGPHEQPYEHGLFAIARRRRPAIAWWWGKRAGEAGPVAVCYICGQVITAWKTKAGPPQRAVREIAEHRWMHRSLVL